MVAAAAVLFATGGAAIKLATLSAWQISSFRSLLAALFLATVQPAWLRACLQPRVLLVAVAYSSTLTLYVTANTLTTAANSIFLQDTAPLYVFLLAPRLLGEPTRRIDLGFAGVLGLGLLLFFVGSESRMPTAPDPATGNAIAAIAGVTWALTLLGLRWLSVSESDDDATGAAVVSGNVLSFLAGASFAFPIRDVDATDVGVILFLGIFQIGLAYLLMVRGVRGVPAVQVSLLLLLEPVCATLLSWLVHGERPGGWSGAGCAVILLATLAHTLVDRSDSPEQATS